MYEPVEKTPEQKSQSVANTISQRQSSNAPTSRFVDNRPEAIQMRKIRELAKNTPQNAKLRELHNLAVANSVAPKKSNVKQGFGFIDNRPEAVAQRKLQVLTSNSTQAKHAAQLQAMADNHAAQHQPIQRKENNTGLPDNLKSGIENLSGYSMDDVKVHYNSDKPAQLQAHAYAQGTDIHLASGQEKHLPHEAWHVVQQKQGRVQPTLQMKSGVNVNDDASLEREADLMGQRISQLKTASANSSLSCVSTNSNTVQKYSIVPFSDNKTDWRLSDDKKMLVKDEEKQAYATQDLITKGEGILAGQNSISKLQVGTKLPKEQIVGGNQDLYTVDASARASGPLGIGPDCGNSARSMMGVAGNQYYRALSRPKGSLKEHTTAARPYVGSNPVANPKDTTDTSHLWTAEILVRAFTKLNIVPVSQTDARKLRKQFETLSAVDQEKVTAEAGINEDAVPDIGQGMIISSLSMNNGQKWNFHFATAIMKSGSDYTTLENDASQPTPQSWYYRMFGSKTKGQSFYEDSKRSGDYGNLPIAILIDPKSSTDQNDLTLKSNTNAWWSADHKTNWQSVALNANSRVQVLYDKAPFDPQFTEVKVLSGNGIPGNHYLISLYTALSPGEERVKVGGDVMTKDVKAFFHDGAKWVYEVIPIGTRVEAINLQSAYDSNFVDVKIVGGAKDGRKLAVHKTELNL